MNPRKVVLAVALGLTLTASTTPSFAQTIDVVHEKASGGFTISFINPCAPADGVVTVSGTIFVTSRRLADGTILNEEHSDLTGTSTTGVPYHSIVQFKGNAASTFDQTVEEISLGSSPNARLHTTNAGTTITCSG